jgi:hypothetical protein
MFSGVYPFLGAEKMRLVTGWHIAKNQYWKFETNIPKKPQSQFPHPCVCERFIYSHGRSSYSAAWNMWTIAHRHMNMEIWTETPQFLEKEYINGIFVSVQEAFVGSSCSLNGFWGGSLKGLCKSVNNCIEARNFQETTSRTNSKY